MALNASRGFFPRVRSQDTLGRQSLFWYVELLNLVILTSTHNESN